MKEPFAWLPVDVHVHHAQGREFLPGKEGEHPIIGLLNEGALHVLQPAARVVLRREQAVRHTGEGEQRGKCHGTYRHSFAAHANRPWF
jgi:hypothetical protein